MKAYNTHVSADFQQLANSLASWKDDRVGEVETSLTLSIRKVNEI